MPESQEITYVGMVDVAVPATLSVGNARQVPDAAGTAAYTNRT